MVSIVVPLYNTEKYIAKCIESILEQTYMDWELILIDDGSTDCSGDICLAYEKQDKRIHYYYQSNRGVSSARNSGIVRAIGEYIYFMDSDDVAEKNLLEKAMYYINKEKLDLLFFNIRSIAEQGEGYWNPPVLTGKFELKNDYQRLKFVMDEFLNFSLYYSCCNKIYVSTIIHANNIFFDEDVAIGEDIGFNLQYLFAVSKIQGIPDVLYQYWKREDSAMSKDSPNVFWFKDFSHMLENVRQHVNKQRISSRKFNLIFIKTMDNQYCKRTYRMQLKPYIKEISNKKFFIAQTVMALCHPNRMIRIFGISLAKRKWKDYLYALGYIL